MRVCVAMRVAGVLAVLGCGPNDSFDDGRISRTSQAMTAPPLVSSPGTLCFTDIRDFHVAVGLEEPEGGWIKVDAPHGEAVLGGTGFGFDDTVATTNVAFVVTSLDPAWDNVHYGPTRRVCAEIGVLNPCELTRACWHADGHWSIEKKSNPGMESIDECADGGVTVLQESNTGNRLPQLQEAELIDPDNTYAIGIEAVENETNQLTVVFARNGLTLRTVVLDAAIAPNPREGFAGVRNDRMKVALSVSGLEDPCPGLGSCTSNGQTTVEAVAVVPERTAYSCGYYDDYAPPFRPMPEVGSLPAVSALTATTGYVFTDACRPMVLLFYSLPPQATQVHIYQDGHRISLPFLLPHYQVSARLLENKSYSYQVVWQDATGALSQPAVVRVTTPSGCIPSRTVDGDYDVAVVPLYYENRGPVPVTRAEAENIVFGNASTGQPKSPAVYIDELSRGTVELRGEAFDWIPLQGSWEQECQGQEHCQFGIPLKDQAESALSIDLDQYDFVMYFVHGGTTNNTAQWQSAGQLTEMNASGVSGQIIHEFLGHGLGRLDHAGGFACTGAVIPGPNLADASGAQSLHDPTAGCGTWGYWDRFSPMGLAKKAYLHTMHLHQLRWISDAEVATDEFGGSYTLGKLDSSFATKQLRVHLYDNWFYFVEYRAGEGLDLATPPGVQVRLWQAAPNAFPDPNAPLGPQPFDSDGEGLLVTNVPLEGGTYCDPHRKVSIEVQGIVDGAAQIEVTREPCEARLYSDGEFCDANWECTSNLCLGGACVQKPTAIDMGQEFACAKFQNGTLRCWGRNESGRLGVSSSGPIGDEPGEVGPTMPAVNLAGPVMAFALGDAHGCAIIDGGAVQCWGENGRGQLGAGAHH